MQNAREEIIKQLKQVSGSLGKEHIEMKLEVPQDPTHGDYSSNIPLQLSKQLGKSPSEIAESVKGQLSRVICLDRVEIASPGFLNFYLSDNYLISNLSQILEKRDKHGTSAINKGKKVIVEFSSPNIAKPFTVGHLRSTIIGNAIANLLDATGWEVHKDNHLGDWGTQFGKQIYAIKEWGNEEELEKSEHPVKDLVELYVKFHQEAEKNPELEDEARAWFKKLEDGDPEAKRLWEKCVQWSIKEFERLYNLLGVSFTENNGLGYGESYFEDKMTPIIKELEDKKLLKEDKGAKLVYFQDDKYPPLMVLKQDGTTLYATRDLATDKFRLEKYGEDVVIINEVGIEQSLYFSQLYEVEKLLGWTRDGQRIHVRHGHFRFPEGKMSTRRGNVIWLEDVIEEAVKRAAALSEKGVSGSEIVATGALKWNDLKRTPTQDVVFDWDDVLNMQGNSGPYVQYAYVRTQSILEKAGGRVVEDISKVVLDADEKMLVRKLIKYPDVVEFASARLAPSDVATYLFELAQAFNLFYQKAPILKSGAREALRLALTDATGIVLKNGLGLLGIKTVEKM